MEKRTKKIIAEYAHEYRGKFLNELDLADMLSSMVDSINCKHDCTSECRRSGCNCACGEFHN